MTTPQLEVVLTGTGVPLPTPGRAGPGTLVRYGDVHLQFDAGRGTGLRLVEAGTSPILLSAVFLTHHHSDHTVDLDDLLMTAWIGAKLTPLVVVAPEGPAAVFARNVLGVWADELELRREHARRPMGPKAAVQAFEAEPAPKTVWSRGQLRVSAVEVHHEPVKPAVAYRVDAPTGSVVISGDTRVCQEVEDLARGADILVHEACRQQAIANTPFAFVTEYHADTIALGAMAARAGVPKLVLTHLIPPPMNDEQAELFAADIRQGGFEGELVVGSDLITAACTGEASVPA